MAEDARAEVGVAGEAEVDAEDEAGVGAGVELVEAADEGVAVPAVEEFDGEGGGGLGVAEAEVGDAHAEGAGVAELGEGVDGPALVGEGGEADLDLRGDVAERAQGIFVVEDEGALAAARDVDLGLDGELTEERDGGEEGGELQAVFFLHVEDGAGALDLQDPLVAVAGDLGDEAAELEPAQQLAQLELALGAGAHAQALGVENQALGLGEVVALEQGLRGREGAAEEATVLAEIVVELGAAILDRRREAGGDALEVEGERGVVGEAAQGGGGEGEGVAA